VKAPGTPRVRRGALAVAVAVAVALSISLPGRALADEPAGPGAGAAWRGVRALRAGRDREAARRLDEALREGFRPARALYPLLVSAYLRLGDIVRARTVVRNWGPAAPEILSRLRPPRLAARAEIGAGWDGNVRLDATASGSGIAAPFSSARLEVAARPLRRLDGAQLALSVDQRIHLAERDRTATYDLSVVTCALDAEEPIAGGAWLLGAGAWGQVIEGDLWARHLALEGGLSVRGAAHPLGAHSLGVRAVLEARNVDGAALGDDGIDEQDGVELVAGPFARLGLAGGRARLELALGYDQAVTRGAAWRARGLGAEAAAHVRLGPLVGRAAGRWRLAAYTADERVEQRLDGGLEASWSLGVLAPFLRLGAEVTIGQTPIRSSRLVGLAGLSAAWRAP